MLPYAASTSSSSSAAIASTSRTLFQSRPSNMRPSTSALSQTARAVSRRHLSHSPVSPAPASSSATSSSPSSARTGLRPQPVSQLALPSRSSRLSQPKSFSALLRSSPASCRGASLVLNNRSFSSSSRSTNAADSRVASIAAERGSNGLGRLAAAIAAFSIAANLYLLYGKPTSSSGQDGVYSYSNPSLPHKYGSATDFNKAIDELKAYFAKATGVGWQDNVSQDESELERRGFDENGHRTDSEGMRPSVVVWPRSTEDVVQIVKIANKYRMPVVPFSGGTSLEGHYTAPFAGISLDMSQMDNIVAFHPEDGDMVVQAGIGWEAINTYLADEGHQMFFPLDPGPGATIGGMIGTGCSGTNAVRYGTARGEHWLNMKVVLANGDVIETRGGGRARKSSAGFDLGKIIIGAEGTLGIVTEATIKLIPYSPASAVACAAFPNVEMASQTVADIQLKGVPVQCIELLDDAMMKAINKSGLCGRQYPEKDMLFFKLSGGTAAVEEAKSMITQASLRNGADKSSIAFETDKEKADKIWEGRKAALWAVRALDPSPSVRVWTTDVCVPLSKLPRLVRETQADLRSVGLDASCIVGHAGDGNFHALIPFDSASEESVKTATEAVARMCHRAQDLDGTCTGEHGVGSGKVEFLERELGAPTLRVMKAVKMALDPLNLLNPGKLYPEPEP